MRKETKVMYICIVLTGRYITSCAKDEWTPFFFFFFFFPFPDSCHYLQRPPPGAKVRAACPPIYLV